MFSSAGLLNKNDVNAAASPRAAYVFGMLPAMHTRMLARLGWIVYLGCCVGASLIGLATMVGILINVGNENGAAIVRTLVIASLAWGFGRTVLFFLARR